MNYFVLGKFRSLLSGARTLVLARNVFVLVTTIDTNSALLLEVAISYSCLLSNTMITKTVEPVYHRNLASVSQAAIHPTYRQYL